METYYKPEHLPRFGEIAEGSKPLADAFFSYYGKVFEDGALTAREKALIALAVSHTVQCPYCIDAYTQESLAKGADLEQMTEAVHVADGHPRRRLARPRPPDARRRQGADDVDASAGFAPRCRPPRRLRARPRMSALWRRRRRVSLPVLSAELVAAVAGRPEADDEPLRPPHASGGASRPARRARRGPRSPAARPATGSFHADLAASGWADGLAPAPLEIFQINVGKLCNMTCRHCHVDSGPDRVEENMDRATVDACLPRHRPHPRARRRRLAPHRRPDGRRAGAQPALRVPRRRVRGPRPPRHRPVQPHDPPHAPLPRICPSGSPRAASRSPARSRTTGSSAPTRSAATGPTPRASRRSARSTRRATARATRTACSRSSPTPSARSSRAARPRWRTSGRRRWTATTASTFDRLIALNNMPMSRYLEWLSRRASWRRTWSGSSTRSTRPPSTG